MCQIQFIQKTKNNKLNDLDKKEFEKLMCFGDMRNHDAYGFFTEKETYKKAGRFNPSAINKIKINGRRFIVGHNRYATNKIATKINNTKKSFIDKLLDAFALNPDWMQNGFYMSEDIVDIQNHPFELGDFVLVHNGVIINDLLIRQKYNIKSKIETDSFSIIYLINKFFLESNKASRIERMTEAINKASRELMGWYSCFIYDKKESNLIYFKEGARFYMKRFKDKIIGSTDYKNLRYLYPNEKSEFINIEDGKIYLITNNGKIWDIGELKEEEPINISDWMPIRLGKWILKLLGFDFNSDERRYKK